MASKSNRIAYSGLDTTFVGVVTLGRMLTICDAGPDTLDASQPETVEAVVVVGMIQVRPPEGMIVAEVDVSGRYAALASAEKAPPP